MGVYVAQSLALSLLVSPIRQTLCPLDLTHLLTRLTGPTESTWVCLGPAQQKWRWRALAATAPASWNGPPHRTRHPHGPPSPSATPNGSAMPSTTQIEWCQDMFADLADTPTSGRPLACNSSHHRAPPRHALHHGTHGVVSLHVSTHTDSLLGPPTPESRGRPSAALCVLALQIRILYSTYASVFLHVLSTSSPQPARTSRPRRSRGPIMYISRSTVPILIVPRPLSLFSPQYHHRNATNSAGPLGQTRRLSCLPLQLPRSLRRPLDRTEHQQAIQQACQAPSLAGGVPPRARTGHRCRRTGPWPYGTASGRPSGGSSWTRTCSGSPTCTSSRGKPGCPRAPLTPLLTTHDYHCRTTPTMTCRTS